jgi:DNA-binding transcriptional ArsR family regulator
VGPAAVQHAERKKWQTEQLAFLSKSLGDEKRLRILLSIAAGRKSVSAIVEELGFSQPLVSHHLKELRRCLLVRVERNGPFVFYELADQRIIQVLGQLQEMVADLLAARNSF